MGDRYYLTLECPGCHGKLDIYYAESCGFTKEKCSCGRYFRIVMDFSLREITKKEFETPDEGY